MDQLRTMLDLLTRPYPPTRRNSTLSDIWTLRRPTSPATSPTPLQQLPPPGPWDQRTWSPGQQLPGQQPPQQQQRPQRPQIDRSGPTPRAPLGAKLRTVDGRVSSRKSKRSVFP